MSQPGSMKDAKKIMSMSSTSCGMERVSSAAEGIRIPAYIV